MPYARTVIGAVLVTMGVAGAAVAGPSPEPRTDDPTRFLERLTGEWEVVSEATFGPGQEPVRTESRAVARLLGGNWLVEESEGSFGETTVISILTVGYDPAQARFVGTWIGSPQTHLWQYTGTLDDAGTVLTLETEGPIMGDASRTAEYRETIEILGPDHRVTRSMILGPDGEWFEFSRAEYRRVQQGG